MQMTTQQEAEASPFSPIIRLALEAWGDGLGVIYIAVAAFNLSMPAAVVVPTVVTAALAINNRLLKKSSDSVIARLEQTLNASMARATVLEEASTPAVIKRADEAAAAVIAGPAPGAPTP